MPVIEPITGNDPIISNTSAAITEMAIAETIHRVFVYHPLGPMNNASSVLIGFFLVSYLDGPQQREG